MQLNENDFAALDDLAKDQNAVMSESDFTKRLLPHLIPPVEGTEARPRDMSIWLEAAGHAHRLIDVVDSNNNVVCTVPPLAARAPTAIPDRENNPNEDLNEISAMYDARIGVEHPHVVNEWYFQSLVSRSYTPGQSMTMLYARMWLTIYRRYNIPLERLFGTKAAQIDQAVPDKAVAESNKGNESNHEISEDDFDPM